jgi:hypothetical protein
MYTFMECLVIAGFVLALGAGVFITVALFVMAEAGVRIVVRHSRRLASRDTAGLRQKLETSPLAPAVVEGE